MLNRIIKEIELSLEYDCYITALMAALTIPDICGKAAFPNETQTNTRYIGWYDEFIGKYEEPINLEDNDMPYTSGEMIYSLRNSLLHQGTPNIDTKKFKEERCKVDRFVLTIAEVYDSGFSSVCYGGEGRIVSREIHVNIVNLCSKICRVAKTYYSENKALFDFFDYELDDRRLDDFGKLFVTAI